MSPQLLLVLMVALLTASLTGLITRQAFFYLPVYWLIGVCAMLAGQVLGRAMGLNLFVVGQVQLGAGLLLNLLMILAAHYLGLWYNGRGR